MRIGSMGLATGIGSRPLAWARTAGAAVEAGRRDIMMSRRTCGYERRSVVIAEVNLASPNVRGRAGILRMF